MKDEEEAKKKAEEDAVVQAAAEAEEAEQKRILEEQQKAEQDRRLAQEQELTAKRSAEWHLIRAQEHECFMMYFNDIADTINQEYNEWQVLSQLCINSHKNLSYKGNTYMSFLSSLHRFQCKWNYS